MHEYYFQTFLLALFRNRCKIQRFVRTSGVCIYSPIPDNVKILIPSTCRKADYSRHMNTHQTENRPKLKCDICDKVYLHKRNLSEHLAVHANKTPLNCEYCDYTTFKIKGLKEHLVTHQENRKLFECLKCNKKYTHSNGLKQHMNSHNAIKIEYPCPKCDKIFTRTDSRRHHLRRVHQNK